MSGSRSDRMSMDAWLSIAVLFFLYVLSFADRQIVAMLVTPLKHDLHLSDVQIGLLIGLSFSLLYAVVGVPMGWLADRLPRRGMIWAGVTGWSVMTCVCGLVHSFGALLLARAGVGVGEAILPSAANSLIADKAPASRRALALSLFAMATSVGDAVSFALGGVVLTYVKTAPHTTLPLIGEIRTWQVLFLLVGLPGLALAPLIFMVKEPERKAASPNRDLASQDFLRWAARHWRLALTYAFSFCLMAMAVSALTQWTPSHMQRAFHWTPAQYGLALGLVFPIAAIAGHLACGTAVDALIARGVKDAPLVFFMAAIVLCGPAAVAGFLASSPWIFLACLVVNKAALTPYLGYAMAGLMNAAPPAFRARVAASFMMVLTLFAGVIGPVLIGAVNDFVFRNEARLGWSVALVIAVCCVVALVALGLGRKSYRTAVAEVEAAAI